MHAPRNDSSPRPSPRTGCADRILAALKSGPKTDDEIRRAVGDGPAGRLIAHVLADLEREGVIKGGLVAEGKDWRMCWRLVS
jgi:hypothetical protein